jgi:hypothetical protein
MLYVMINIIKGDGKTAGFGLLQEKDYCIAPLIVVLFVCGVSPPPPLESRLSAGGVSTSATGFFSGISVAQLSGVARLCPQKVPVLHVFLQQMLDQ